MSNERPFVRLVAAFATLFIRAAVVMWVAEYLQDITKLPDLHYWQSFWLVFASWCFHPFCYPSKKEWEDEFR